MKKLILSFCILAFGVSAMMADELSTRLMWNCVERKKLNEPNKAVKVMAAECMSHFDNTIAKYGSDKGSAYLIEAFGFIWLPEQQNDAINKILRKILDERAYDVNDANFQKVKNEADRLVKQNDYKTLACLYIGNTNVKCLK